MTSPLHHHLHAMPMSMSPSAGSARACRREQLCIAPVSPFTPSDMHPIGDVPGAVSTRRHTGTACILAVIGTPLPQSP